MTVKITVDPDVYGIRETARRLTILCEGLEKRLSKGSEDHGDIQEVLRHADAIELDFDMIE